MALRRWPGLAHAWAGIGYVDSSLALHSEWPVAAEHHGDTRAPEMLEGVCIVRLRLDRIILEKQAKTGRLVRPTMLFLYRFLKSIKSSNGKKWRYEKNGISGALRLIYKGWVGEPSLFLAKQNTFSGSQTSRSIFSTSVLRPDMCPVLF